MYKENWIKGFNPDNISEMSFIFYENKIFEDEEDLIKYLDSCECEYETLNFSYERRDFLDYLSEEELTGDDPDVDLDEMFDEYQNYLDKLSDELDISWKCIGRGYSGARYKLWGTFENMKKFAKECPDYLDMSSSGEGLYDVAENAKIDYDSGDSDLFICEYKDGRWIKD